MMITTNGRPARWGRRASRANFIGTADCNIYLYIHICIYYIYVYIYIYIHTCICVYIHTMIYIYIYTHKADCIGRAGCNHCSCNHEFFQHLCLLFLNISIWYFLIYTCLLYVLILLNYFNTCAYYSWTYLDLILSSMNLVIDNTNANNDDDNHHKHRCYKS